MLHCEGYISYERHMSYEICIESNSVAKIIREYAKENGVYSESNKGLGEEHSCIPNCSVHIFFTDEKCTLEEAECSLINQMFGEGTLFATAKYRGYSEYTISGLELDTLKVGGHDILAELKSHRGEYCHFLLESGG